MLYVEFYKLQNDGTQKVIAKCILGEDGGVTCDGDEVFVKNLATEGIMDYSSPDRKKLFFHDGTKFLDQLKFNFASGYLNASEVKKEWSL